MQTTCGIGFRMQADLYRDTFLSFVEIYFKSSFFNMSSGSHVGFMVISIVAHTFFSGNQA